MADFFGDMYPGLFEEKKNAPGFVSDIKRGTGQLVSSVGSTLQDIGAPDLGSDIESYGEKVVRRNPSQINTLEDALSSPLTTAREAVGEVVPQVGASVAMGLGGRVLGGALGAFGGPVGVAIGQNIGAGVGAYAGNLIQSYGGIRSEQRISGREDIGRAIAAGSASAALDTAFGAERVANKVLGKGTSFLSRAEGDKLLPHVGTQFARGFAEEAGTEVVQTGLERVGAFKGVTGEGALDEYGLAAIKGGFGGGAIRGGLSTIAGERRDGSLLADANIDTNLRGTTETDAIAKAINPGANLSTLDVINQNANVQAIDTSTRKQREQDITAAFNEPSGRRVVDPDTGLERELTAYEVQQQQLGLPPEASVNNAVQQAGANVQQAAQAEAKSGEELAKLGFVFGVATNPKGIADIAGKRLYGPQQTRAFLTELDAAMQGRTKLDLALAGAAVKSGLAKITDTGNVKQLINKIGKVLDTYQLSAVETAEEVQEILNDQIARLEGASATKRADEINSLYAALTGQPAPAYLDIQNKLAEVSAPKEKPLAKPAAKTVAESKSGEVTNIPVEQYLAEKGDVDGQLQLQQQSDTGLRAVSEQGRTDKTSRTTAGDVRSTSVQPVESGSVGERPLGLQVGAVPNQRVSAGTATNAAGATTTETVSSTQEKVVSAQAQVRALIIDAFGLRNANIILDTLQNDLSQSQLGEKYGLTQQAVSLIVGPSAQATWGPRIELAAKRKGLSRSDVANLLAELSPEDNAIVDQDLVDDAVKDEEGINTGETFAATETTTRSLAEEMGNEEQTFEDADLGASAFDQRDLEDTGRGNRGFGVIGSIGGTQSNTQESQDLTAQWLAAIEAGDVEKANELADQIGGKTRAVQVESPAKVSVRQRTKRSKKVGKGNAKPESTTGEVKQTETQGEIVVQEQKEVEAWSALPVPIQYDQLSPQAKADWAVAVKEGKINLAAANKVYEDNMESIQAQIADDSKTIDGKDLITEVGEEKQRLLITDQTNKLTEAQNERLEKHYGAKRDSDEFFQKLREDVLNYVNKGAEAVAGAIRDIVKQIANGVMAMAVVFNPQFMGQPEAVTIPVNTVQIVQAKVPTAIDSKMSEAAKKAYATLLPALQKQMKEQNKYFTIVDKPTSTVFVFNPDGTLLDSRVVVLGKALGDFYVGKTDFAKNRVTPAGLFVTQAEKGSATYDGKTVYTLANEAEDWNVVFMHPVYLKESDAQARKDALATGKNTRLSYGCINGPLDFMAKIDNSKMDKSHIFIVPDNQAAVDDFIANRISNEDLTRVTVKPVTKTVPGKIFTTTPGQKLVGKEEKVKAEKASGKTFANRKLKLFPGVIRKLTQAQFDVLSNLKYEKVQVDSEKDEQIEVAFVSLPDLLKFPAIQQALVSLKDVPRALQSVDRIAIFKNDGALEGADGIQSSYIDADGNVRTILALNESSFLSREDADITHTFLHELGHTTDLPGYAGGVYSSQPEFSKGGAVRRELANLWTNDADFEFLSYPFADFTAGKSSETTLRGELFAQVWAAFLNPQFKAVLKAKAPQTYAFMEDVVNDIKTTTFSTGTPEAVTSEVKWKAELFANYRGQELEGTKGDKTIKLTPAEQKYVDSVAFPEDLYQFAQDEGFQNEILANSDNLVVGKDTLTIPESMVPAMRKFFDWLFYSPSGYLGTLPPRFRSGKTFFAKGASSPAVAKIRQGTQARIDKMPPAYRNTAQKLYDFLVGRNLSDRLIATFAFTQDVVANAVKNGLTSAATYKRLDDARKEVLARWSVRVEDTLKDFNKLSQRLQGTGPGTVNAFLKDSTMEGKWGFQPDWLKTKVVVDPVMAQRFKEFELDPLAQKVIKDVFKFNYEANEAMKKVVVENTSSEFDALIAQAKAQGNAKEVAKLTKQKASSLREYQTLLDINSAKPYAALKRFGNIVVVAKSQEYIDAEKAKDAKVISNLETQEKHYVVKFFESNSEAQAEYRKMESMGYAYLTKPFDSADAAEAGIYGGRDLNGLFYRLRNMAQSDKNDKASLGINKLLNDLHLRLLSEQSARQSENRRKNITGADDDMMRSFATQGRASAHFLSSLHNSGKIYDALQAMRKQRDEVPSNKDVASVYYNELMARHGLNMTYTQTPVVDAALTVTSTWMLLTSPAYFLQNATQPWLLSLPYMSARFKDASSTLLQSYKDISSVVGKSGITQAEYAKLPADVRDAIEELVNRGTINISLSSEIGRFRSSVGQTKDVFEKAGNVYAQATDGLRGIAENLESVNRVATAVAAYRLAIKDGKMSAEQAIDYAEEVINNTHGDYSNSNAPRFMRTGLGRVATQFRKFQLIQISLLARMYKDWRQGESKEVRQVAFKQLMFTLGHTFAVGGLMGLPGFTAIATVAGALFGDDDEPDNPELFLREMIGDPMIADLLVRGVPAALGVDLSGKLGMGQMLSVLPYTDLKMTKESYQEAMLALFGGPFAGGLAPRVVNGLQFMAAGDYWKGIEQLLPKGLSDAAKGVRLATEGVTDKRGDVLLSADEINFLEATLTGLGLPTTDITKQQFKRGVQIEADKFYSERTTEMKRDYVKAAQNNDTQRMNELRQEWLDIQEKRKKYGQTRQPLSDLLKAPREQKKREGKNIGGIQYTGSNRGLAERLSNI